MATKLDKTIKREIDLDGQPYTVAISPEGIKLTQKGFRKGREMSWRALLAGSTEEGSGGGAGGGTGGTGGGGSTKPASAEGGANAGGTAQSAGTSGAGSTGGGATAGSTGGATGGGGAIGGGGASGAGTDRDSEIRPATGEPNPELSL